MPRKRTPAEIANINADLRTRFGATMTRAELLAYKDETGVFPVWIYRDPACKAGRSLYSIPGGSGAPAVARTAPAVPARRATRKERKSLVAPAPEPTMPTVTSTPLHEVHLSAADFKASDIHTKMRMIRDQASALAVVPSKDPAFVPFGDYAMIESVVASKRFCPIFITGLSGNGKTFGVEQACAASQREYIRANCTLETDEDDLFGGFRLIDGNTVFELGPVVVAMIRGAVLLLDEIDLSGAKAMCLQPVLEGHALTLKKLGITIPPAPGFTIFATANTKGRGDLDGKFVGTNLLNEAFLERFYFTVEQDYPSASIERKILTKTYTAEGYQMTDLAAVFFDTLAKWAEGIRKTAADGALEDVISTRRLCHIVRAYGMFGSTEEAQQMALSYSINRFDARVKDAFIDLYNKLAPDDTAQSNVGSVD